MFFMLPYLCNLEQSALEQHSHHSEPSGGEKKNRSDTNCLMWTDGLFWKLWQHLAVLCVANPLREKWEVSWGEEALWGSTETSSLVWDKETVRLWQDREKGDWKTKMSEEEGLSLTLFSSALTRGLPELSVTVCSLWFFSFPGGRYCPCLS